MVFTGGEEEERVKNKNNSNFVEMGPLRKKPLHNFDLPFLKWGNQRQLRCMKVDPDDDGNTNIDKRSVDTRFQSSLTINQRRDSESERRKLRVLNNSPKPRMESFAGEEGIEAVREKLIFDLKRAADKMKVEILREKVAVAVADGDDEVVEKEVELPPVDVMRPWNLRTRRAACKVPIGRLGGVESKGLKIEERKPIYSPLRSDGNNGFKSPTPRIVSRIPEKRERAKFSVPLSKKEIEEDFMAMLGHRPPRRPKKRPRNVQRQIDVCQLADLDLFAFFFSVNLCSVFLSTRWLILIFRLIN